MTKHKVKQKNIGMCVEFGLYCVDQGPRTNWCMYNLLGVLMMFEYTLHISPCEGLFLLLRHVSQRDRLECGLNFQVYGS
jgi:hypothetical protein